MKNLNELPEILESIRLDGVFWVKQSARYI